MGNYRFDLGDGCRQILVLAAIDFIGRCDAANGRLSRGWKLRFGLTVHHPTTIEFACGDNLLQLVEEIAVFGTRCQNLPCQGHCANRN
jgi:hypothetical protein